MNGAMTGNTSGQGTNAVVPPEIRGWNWGAFLLTWIWGVGNNVLIALLTLVPIVGIVMWIILGLRGSEWAWQQKRWDSVEHFQRVQRAWAKWGLIILLATFVLASVLCAAIFFIVIAAMKSTQPYRDGVDRLQAEPAAMAALGAPVTTGIPSGSINTSNGEGSVNLQIRVHGSNKSGVLYVEGQESEGRWHYSRIDLVVDQQHIELGNDDETGR